MLIIYYVTVALLLPFLGSIMAAPKNGVCPIEVEEWGMVNEQTVYKYDLTNTKGHKVSVINYGATIVSIEVPDRKGDVVDVVLGYDNISGYLSPDNPYFGATVGRVANRIGKGQFTLNGTTYHVTINNGENSLHGGKVGWDKKVWNSTIQGESVLMTLLSEDGDQGYPGAVIASVSFSLTIHGELAIEMKGFTTKATPINLTNHAYFNLAGHGTNAEELYKHRVTINADHWTFTDLENIPTGQILSVKDTVMDFRTPTVIGTVIDKVPNGGYDYNLCVSHVSGHTDHNRFVAKVVHPPSGRVMEVFSNQPGVQFYTGNQLPDVDTEGIIGKDQQHYYRHGAFCLETQNYPDAVNHPNFPNSILLPGEVYHHTVTYKFGVL